MQNDEKEVTQLIKKMFNSDLYNQWKAKENQSLLKTHKKSNQAINSQIQNLDIEDYLQLFANQKKNLSTRRWTKLMHINQNRQLEQQSFKHIFAVASQANYRRLEHPGYYKQILSAKQKYPPIFFNSIEKDIPRTLTSTNPFQQPLRDVLCAYAMRNPSLLYCQGLNYIVAYLLMNQMSPEQTFWFMSCLIENILPDDYFKDLTTISIVSCIFNDLLEQTFPEFKFQMNEIGMDASIFLVPWFVCLFTKGFINSVSAYLMNVILLQTRNYTAGFVLLKISIALIAIVINRQQPFRYSKDFKSFKDMLQTKIFEISLSQIKQGLQIVEFNYQIYVKIEELYRKEKELTRSLMLKGKDKKIPLPPCNKDFPICFHRFEMQKKIGNIQGALILKNGLNIRDQMVNNYLERQIQYEAPDIHYDNIKICPIGRQGHICHFNQQDYISKLQAKTARFQRQTVHKIQILGDEEQQLEKDQHYSNIVQRYAELSEYFEVDENYLQDYQKQDCDEELQKQFQQFSKERPQEAISAKLNKIAQTTMPKKIQIQNKFSLVNVGRAIKNVLQKTNIFKKIRQGRSSKQQIQSENGQQKKQ